MIFRWLLLLTLLTSWSQHEATWRYETAPPDDGTPSDDDDDDDLVYEKVLWGFIEGDEGWTGFYFADPDQGGELCEVESVLESWDVTDDCAECEEARLLVRGEEEVHVDVDGACTELGWIGLEGTTFGVGHDGGSIWADLGGGWEVMEDAYAEQEDDWSWFEIWFGD